MTQQPENQPEPHQPGEFHNQPQGFVGKGYPLARPFNVQTLWSDPDQRWPLLAALAGHYVVMAAFFAWASMDLFGETVQLTGTAGSDGWLTLVLGLAVMVLGALYLVNPKLRGKLWVPIVKIVCGSLITYVAMIDLSNAGDGVNAGFGLILTLLLGLAIVGAAVMHLLELRKRRTMHF